MTVQLVRDGAAWQSKLLAQGPHPELDGISGPLVPTRVPEQRSNGPGIRELPAQCHDVGWKVDGPRFPDHVGPEDPGPLLWVEVPGLDGSDLRINERSFGD